MPHGKGDRHFSFSATHANQHSAESSFGVCAMIQDKRFLTLAKLLIPRTALEVRAKKIVSSCCPFNYVSAAAAAAAADWHGQGRQSTSQEHGWWSRLVHTLRHDAVSSSCT